MGSSGDLDQLRGERRRAYRVAVDGTGFLWHGDRLSGCYALSDISTGGCLLRHGPDVDPGYGYRLVLHVTARPAIRLPARVVRCRHDAGACDIGVRFTARPPRAQDQIHDLVMRNLEGSNCMRAGRVLVLHPDAVRRRPLAETIRLLGYEVVEACTPLEAVWELENGPMDIRAVFVAGGVGDGSDIVRFIAVRYPQVRRVLVDVADGSDAGGADFVLESPLSAGRLRKVIPARDRANGLRARR